MEEIRELLRLMYELGRSHREIAASLGIANSTVSDYVRRASAVGFSWPLPEGLHDAALAAALFPSPPTSRVRRSGRVASRENGGHKTMAGIDRIIAGAEGGAARLPGFHAKREKVTTTLYGMFEVVVGAPGVAGRAGRGRVSAGAQRSREGDGDHHGWLTTVGGV